MNPSSLYFINDRCYVLFLVRWPPPDPLSLWRMFNSKKLISNER